jgi:hypothetical protein
MRLNRAYVTFAKKIDDVWSVKVTLDGVDYASGARGSAVFIKNAYVEMKQKFDPAEFKIQYGVVGTPIIGITDQISGARWIYQNYMDKSSDVLAGDSLDVSSADMGILASLNIMKMVTITGMYSNGEGYRYTEEQTQSATGTQTDKAYYGVLSITPVAGLYINGYYHQRDENAGHLTDYAVNYYGAGLAWSDKSFKIGGNYFTGERDPELSGATGIDYTIMDIWALINLGEVAGVPVLLYGRYATGERDPKAAGAKTSESSTYYAGLGYQFNKNVQTMLVYQSKTDDNGTDESTDEALMVKVEAKF